jgi:RDD family protein
LTARDPNASTPLEGPLADLPLRPAQEEFPTPFAPPEGTDSAFPKPAPLSRRAVALGADAAAAFFTTAAALLAATRVAQRPLGLAAAGWSGAFAFGLFFFATVVPLALFGRTPGMALAGVSAAPSSAGRRLTLSEALARWFGTVLAAATLGLALLWGHGAAGERTPADRLSGRPLVEDGNEELRIEN